MSEGGAIRFAGFDLPEVLHDEGDALLLRCVRQGDGRPVLVWLAAMERLQRELAVLQHLAAEAELRGEPLAAPRALGLERDGAALALVLDDPGGVALEQLLGGQALPVELAVELALAITSALARVHAAGVLHRDLRPAHVLVDLARGSAALVGFAAAVIADEAAPVALPAGAAAYQSPEMTGRTGRTSDHRSDYYALGALIYHMLTGRPPFDESDPLRLIHAHIVRLPPAPDAVRPAVPRGLSRIVLKLLAKTPEARYQSTHGIRADLLRCRDELLPGVAADFEPGSEDRSERLQLPDLLLGRGELLTGLLAVYEGCAAGPARLVLLTGPTGIGKSALLRELQAQVAARGGQLAPGACLRLDQAAPYAALAQGVQALARQVLAGSGQPLQAWRERLLAALAGEAGLLFDVLPELALVLGPQPQVPALPPVERANRFRRVFRQLLRGLARPQQPLLVVLEDVQWCDQATLQLLGEILGAGDTRHLMIVASLRGHTPEPGSPLAATLTMLAGRDLAAVLVELRPLRRDEVAAWLAEALRPCPQDLGALVDLAHASSAGNPFLLRLLAQSLHEQRALRFNGELGVWEWRPQQVAQARLPDDLGVLVTERLRELSPAAREAVSTAACVGLRCELPLLASLLQQTPAEVAATVHEATARGLVLAVAGGYQFLHERVQQAASAELSPARAQALHLAIGRALAGSDVGDFEVVHHLNLGAALVVDPGERRELAARNLAAAQRALAATAVASAASYARAGAAALGPDLWADAPGLAFALARAEMEALYLLGEVEAGRALYDPLLARALDELDRAGLCELKVGLDIFHGHQHDALACGLAGLARLGVMLPAHPDAAAVAARFAALGPELEAHELAALIELPVAREPLPAAAMRILMAMGPAAMFVDGRLAFTIFMAIVGLSLRHGATRATGYGFAGLGMYLAAARQHVHRADALGQLALRLNARVGDDSLTAKIHQLVGALIVGWVRPFAEAHELLVHGYRLGLRTGDLMTACYNATSMILVQIARGASVGDVRDDIDMLQRESGRVLDVYGGDVIRSADRWCRVLVGELPAPTPAGADAWIAEVFDLGFEQQTALTELYLHIYRTHLLVLFGCHAAVRPLPPRARERLQALASPVAVDAFFLHGLVAAARLAAPGLSDDERRGALAELADAARRFTAWAADCPANFAARHAILCAEQARSEGRDDAAAAAYKEAVRVARRHGELGSEALACELAGRHAAAVGDDVLSDMYLQAGSHAYARWGAELKAQQLAPEHGLRPRRAASEVELASAFDLSSLIRAARALSGEIRLERLLRSLLEIAMENAGARRGVVVLAVGDEWRVEAEGDADPPDIRVGLATSIDAHGRIPLSVVRYVARSQQDVLLAHAARDGEFRGDPYIAGHGVRSLLCTPVVHHGRCTGVLYLEHSLSEGVFTAARLELVKQLAAQLAVSVENARLVEDLQRARSEAVAAERVKGRFLLNMSHELRTPLNAVIGYAELMQESLALGHHETLGGDLVRIRRAAYHLLRTLSGILELSKLSTGAAALETARVDLAGLVREVAAECNGLAVGRGNLIEVSCPPDIGSAYTDRAMLHYCLHSLVENACKFTRGGRVTVAVERIVQDGRAYLLFTVSDTGIGIPASHLEAIFNAFTQVDDAANRAYEGAGVGLTVTRQFGRMLGGEVSVVSEVGRGSTFTLRVPASFAG
ncbi:MAG: AAA family ATPase [Nannocystis sp.]|uniref:sensor histidine kinase n=1 Tax=Nannocystis sp. TaxID=1962667 RepID=UPI002423AD49|nr:AAA family ATPase [Nannocystis sp.]MBK9752298.1 AAA family ATPase [Nannocystis sp.]